MGRLKQMNMRNRLFRDTGFHVLLFVLGLLLFSWPIMGIAGDKGSKIFFIYLFLAWIAVIVLLFFIGKNIALSSDSSHGDQGTSGADDV